MGTKYEIIINYIKTEIESGFFKDKLPSIRALAIKFSCSNSTVIRAYSELEKQNLIYALPKSGYFVVENKFTTYNSNNRSIDFYSGEPDNGILPYENFQDCMNLAISQYKHNIFSYSLSSGFFPLKQTINNMLTKNGINSSGERLVITSGAQQAITLLSTLPFPNLKETILIEQPSYNLYLRWLISNNLKIEGIERNFSGIDLNKLEQLFKFKDIKFFYTMPRLHNPLGASYSEEQKKQIVYLANKYDVYIVEDDYLSDINENNDFPLSHYDDNEKVIYLKSFSKLLLPGIRIAACLLPENLISNFDNYKTYSTLTTAVPLQGALNLYINNGLYDSYISKVKKFYSNKMKLLRNQLNNFKKFNINYAIPNNGLFTLLKFNDNFSLEELLNNVNSRDVEFRNGNHFFLKEFNNEKTIRISLTKANEEKIIRGFEVLYSEMDKLTNSCCIRKNNLLEV